MRSLQTASFDNDTHFMSSMAYTPSSHPYPHKDTIISINITYLAWSIMAAIKYIRTFPTNYKIAHHDTKLWKSIQHIPISYYHGSFDKIDLDTLQYPSNFNSWSLKLEGAIYLLQNITVHHGNIV